MDLVEVRVELARRAVDDGELFAQARVHSHLLDGVLDRLLFLTGDDARGVALAAV